LHIKYSPEDIIKIAKVEKKAKSIWAYDECKKQLILSKGYKYLAIWESEMTDMSNEELMDRIKGHI